LRDVARVLHTWPDGRAVRVSLRTLQRWVKRFKKGGLPALGRTSRKDKGRVRALNEAAVARVIALRHEGTWRSTPTLIDIVERAGEVAKGSLRRSTLDRHLDRRGASRRMLHVLGEKRHVRLHSEHPLDFVLGDFHAGPHFRTATGEVRRAELGAFIDHCSRFVPESRYGVTEDLMHVRRGLRAFVIAHGLPRRLYVDRGPGYKAERFHFGRAKRGSFGRRSRQNLAYRRLDASRLTRVDMQLEITTPQDVRNWSPAPPPGAFVAVSLSEKAASASNPPLDPLGALTVRQRVVPLETAVKVARLGAAKAETPLIFELKWVWLLSATRNRLIDEV
jgi:transposase